MLRGLETGAVQGAVNGRLSVKRDWVFDFGIGMIFALYHALHPPAPRSHVSPPIPMQPPAFFVSLAGFLFFVGFFLRALTPWLLGTPLCTLLVPFFLIEESKLGKLPFRLYMHPLTALISR